MNEGYKIIAISPIGEEFEWLFPFVPIEGQTGQKNYKTFVVFKVHWNLDKKIIYVNIKRD